MINGYAIDCYRWFQTVKQDRRRKSKKRSVQNFDKKLKRIPEKGERQSTDTFVAKKENDNKAKG